MLRLSRSYISWDVYHGAGRALTADCLPSTELVGPVGLRRRKLGSKVNSMAKMEADKPKTRSLGEKNVSSSIILFVYVWMRLYLLVKT